MKSFKKCFIFILLLMFVVSLGACALGWKRPTEATYKDVGLALESCRQIGIMLEANGKLSGENLTKAKALYKTARDMYRTAADILVLIADAEDSVKQKTLIADFDEMLFKIPPVIVQIQKIYEEVK